MGVPLKFLFIVCIVLLYCESIIAQLCQGSLGDPVVNITFGSGSNPGPPLPTTANLQYLDADCPNDGFYTVRNATSQCFSNSWHSVPGDHTGDNNGYFMLVNASFSPSQFFIDTVSGLCPNTTYEFATWIMNVSSQRGCNGTPVMPNLTLSIEETTGNVLKTYNTGNIAPETSPQWKQYGFFFTTPAAAQKVVLRIKNNAVGGCGNDIAIDDITFRPCGPKVDAFFENNSQVSIIDLCEGEGGIFTLNGVASQGFSNPSYRWQQQNKVNEKWEDVPGATGNRFQKEFFSSSVPGSYLYRLTVAGQNNIDIPGCRVSSTPIIINVNSKPVIITTGGGVVCEGQNVLLTATGGKTYRWANKDSFVSADAAVVLHSVSFADSGKYKVEVTNIAGCKQSDSLLLQVSQRPKLSMPFYDTAICAGRSLQLSVAGAGSYRWFPDAHLSNPDISNPWATPIDTTIYTVIGINSFCADTVQVQVNVIPIAKVNSGPDLSIMEGQQVQIAATALGTGGVQWVPDYNINSTTILQPVVAPAVDTFYTIIAASVGGCGFVSDTVRITVFKSIQIPNAFSPNGDGINDNWRIPALSFYTNYQLLVFSRWGSLVLSSKNYQTPWNGMFNGSNLPVGVYYYSLNLPQIDKTLTGSVTILR